MLETISKFPLDRAEDSGVTGADRETESGTSLQINLGLREGADITLPNISALPKAAILPGLLLVGRKFMGGGRRADEWSDGF